jgi:hypothetical protein
MAGVNDVEHYQPAQDCRYEQQEHVDSKKFVDEPQ